MEIDILSLFPEYFDGLLDYSIIGKAIKNDVVQVRSRNIRDFGLGKWKQVDDATYHSSGMLLMAEPVVRAIRSLRREGSRVVYLSPQGALLTAKKSRELAASSHLILLCGHYEGIDERAIESEVDEEISIGDYILTNGGIAAVVVIDALSRFVPGVLGNQESVDGDSLENGLLKGPQYTRPRVFENKSVPEILLQGNHQAISRWRKQVSLERTRERRPDLYLHYFCGSKESATEETPESTWESGEAKVGIVLEVEDAARAWKFYSRLFRLHASESDQLCILGHRSFVLRLQEVGLENKNITTLTLRLHSEDALRRFLRRWTMLGGSCVQEKNRGMVWSVRDLDHHMWIVSCD